MDYEDKRHPTVVHIICVDSKGKPVYINYKIGATDAEIKANTHHRIAISMAKNEGFHGPFSASDNRPNALTMKDINRERASSEIASPEQEEPYDEPTPPGP